VFTYNANQQKINILRASKAIALEIVVVLLLVGGLLTFLNYFKILPVSSSFPFLSFLPQQGVQTDIVKTQITNNTNNQPVVTNPVKVSLQAANPDLKTFVSNIQLDAQILDIASKSGVFEGKNGLVNYVAMLKLKTGDFVRTWYYDKEEFQKVKIVKSINGVEQPMNFADLKIGDTIMVNVKNDNKTSKLLELKIVKK